jgi:hypothetical protein
VFHFLVDSPNLSFRLTAADNKVISEAANSSGIQQRDVARLFFAGGINSLTGYFYGFQNSSLQKCLISKL